MVRKSFYDIYLKYGFILIKNHQRIINGAVSHKIRIGEDSISTHFIAVISSLRVKAVIREEGVDRIKIKCLLPPTTPSPPVKKQKLALTCCYQYFDLHFHYLCMIYEVQPLCPCSTVEPYLLPHSPLSHSPVPSPPVSAPALRNFFKFSDIDSHSAWAVVPSKWSPNWS